MKQFDWTKEFETVDELVGFSYEAQKACNQWAFCAIGEKYQLAERFVTTIRGTWEDLQPDEWTECHRFVNQLKHKQALQLGLEFTKAVNFNRVTKAKQVYQQIQELPDET